MRPTWTPELEIDEAGAAERIAAQFPELAPVRCRLLGVGWDNAAFVVNEGTVFRFPRRQVAAALIETEARALPALAPRLPLPIPTPRWVGAPSEDFPWPFAGYPLLPGRTLCRARVSDVERAALARPLGAFLRALHASPTDGLGLPPDTIRRLDLEFRLPRARENLAAAAGRGDVDDPAALRRLIDAAPTGYAPRDDAVVHGDLYVRHLLVDADCRLSGVIDWGDIHRGDPALDLAAAHTVLPVESHAGFRDAYGPIDEDVWAVARLRALWHTLLVLPYAHETRDDDLLRECRWTLREIGAV